MQPHRFDQPLRFPVDLIIRHANYRPAQRLKHPLPLKITRGHFVQPMHPAIDLNDQAQPVTGKVRKVRPDRMLTPELVAVDPASA